METREEIEGLALTLNGYAHVLNEANQAQQERQKRNLPCRQVSCKVCLQVCVCVCICISLSLTHSDICVIWMCLGTLWVGLSLIIELLRCWCAEVCTSVYCICTELCVAEPGGVYCKQRFGELVTTCRYIDCTAAHCCGKFCLPCTSAMVHVRLYMLL